MRNYCIPLSLLQQQAENSAHASSPLDLGANEGVAHHRSRDLDASPSGMSPPSGSTYAHPNSKADVLGSQGRCRSFSGKQCKICGHLMPTQCLSCPRSVSHWC